MIIEKIGTGKTLDDAIAQAKALLNAPLEADVKVETLEMGSKGFLGLFGAKDYKVKASYEDNSKPVKAEKKPAKKPAPKKQAPAKKDAPKKEAAPKQEAPKNDAPKKEQKKEYPQSVDLEFAKQYLMSILDGLKIVEPKIEATYTDGVVTMNLDCEDYGIIIGHRGETLDAIQDLLSLVMKKTAQEHIRVIVNVGNYREKRQETLKNLAKKNAAYVLRTGRRHTFEPMNPYERRIIHTAIQEIDGVESRSVGYNKDRKVVIEPVGGVKKTGNGGNYRKGGRPQSTTKAPENHTPKADRADLPKFGKIEVPVKD